jgi:serine/threonine protein kinase/Tfp pilus assembly protein PilF
MIGQTVSHYRILEPLGEGAMGTVYLAEDTLLGRRVAIKFPSLKSDTHEHRARFLREARSVSELNHPGIATLFDYGQTETGRPFLVMELAKGRPMSELMHDGQLNLERAVNIVIDVATALSEAHARGVVHRDIKPSNVMIDDNGNVKVLDFGLAKQLNKDSWQTSEPEAQTLLSTGTRSGVVVGTPAYLSPEQATSGEVDERSDLFALGTVLYEAITGRSPFTGKSFIEIAANVLHVQPPAPSKFNPAVPRALDFITMKALAKRPKDRYQTAKDFIGDLTSVKENLEAASGQTLIRQTGSLRIPGHSGTLSSFSQALQRPRIPISYILIGVAVLALGAVALFWLLRPRTHTPTAEAERWFDLGTNAIRDGAFYQATQALQRAVSADGNYMLAHARLAEAMVELDYIDQAKDELLRVNSADKAKIPPLDALYIDAITASARQDFPAAIDKYKQIISKIPEKDKSYALVDLGRAYENNNDMKNAVVSYKEASTRNTQYPTAYLRLGILYGQQGDLSAALQAFQEAESLYQALGSLEGRAEVTFQRGSLFNKRNKLPEAKEQLEQALTLAKANDNKSQTIKTLLQLCSVAFDQGEVEKSTGYAQQAISLAQQNGLENLSTRGLVDLGNSFVVRGKQAEAENYLQQALAAADRAKALRTAARARVALANLRQQQNRSDEAVKYLEPALKFYQQGGYRSETFSCLALLARANIQKGDYAAATSSQEQLLQLAQELNDQSLLALAHAERGSLLARQEKFGEALDHLNQAYTIYSAQGIQRSMGYNLGSRAEILMRLGKFDESKNLLDQAMAIANKPGGELKRLAAESQLALAWHALLQNNYSGANANAAKAMEMAGTEFKAVQLGAKLCAAIADSASGSRAAARQSAADGLEIATQLNDPAQIAVAQLVSAIAALDAGDSVSAASLAKQAEEVFARLNQASLQWQALVLLAQASQNSGDKTRATEYAVRARDTLATLEQRWGSDNFNSYLNRPDIQVRRKQLAQLVGS